jgi:hypothetical protein
LLLSFSQAVGVAVTTKFREQFKRSFVTSIETDLFLDELQMLSSDVRDKRQRSNKYLEGLGLPPTIRMSSETEVEVVVGSGDCQEAVWYLFRN